MTRIRRHWVALALPPLVMGLASCGIFEKLDSFAVAPPAKADAQVGGTLRVGITRPGGIDPVNAYEPMGKLIVSTMCDTLVTLDPETAQVREGLTESVVFSPDGTTVTFKMRRNLTFNDGTKLSPRDVDFSFRRLRARSTASYVRSLIDPFAEGIAAAHGAEAPAEATESVLADDAIEDESQRPIAQGLNEADFQMFTPEGNGGALRAIAEPAFTPISRAAYRRDPIAFASNPVCVGPYKLAKPYQPGATSILLERTPGYYAKNVGYTGGGRGYVDRIKFTIFPTAERAYAAFGKGTVDVVAVPPTRAADARRFGSALVTGRATDVEFLGVPTGSHPFSSVELRQAMSLVLDRKALAATLGPAYVPATGFLPPALDILPGDQAMRTDARMTGASRGARFDGCPDLSRRDVARAKDLFAKEFAAPTGDETVDDPLGKPLTLYVNADGRYDEMARLAAKQWKEALGLEVVVKPLRWADYLQRASQGFDGAFRLSWATDATAPVPMFHDPQPFLEPLFTTLGLSNWSHWVSQEFDLAFTEDAAKVTDIHDRGVGFGKLETMLCDELPLMPVAFGHPQYLVRDTRLETARESYLHAATGMPLLREIYRR